MRAVAQAAAATGNGDPSKTQRLRRRLKIDACPLQSHDARMVGLARRAPDNPAGRSSELADGRRAVQDSVRNRFSTKLEQHLQAGAQTQETRHVERAPFPTLG